MIIRKYNEKDFDSIRRICKATCNDKQLLKNEVALYSRYADYYTIYEKENIFVLCNDYEDVVGYILCSTSPEIYKNTWKSLYRKTLNGKGWIFQKILLKLSLFDSKRMQKEGYSCHMHIDILFQYQHLGYGSKLVNSLIEHLKNNNKDGLYLGCSQSNTNANKFYKKLGFKLHHSYLGCNVYSLKLK